MNYKLRTTKYKRHRRGMALLAVLFIVFAITVISMGLLYRSDMALACGQNLCLRNQSDYLAWAGLEHARAVIQSYYGQTPLSEPNAPEALSIGGNNFDYALSIETPSINAVDPNNPLYTYDVTSEGWYGSEADKQTRSSLMAAIAYDPNDGKAEFLSISRQ